MDGNKVGLLICSRCRNPYDNPFPEVVNPEGDREIATELFCANCNALVMTCVKRDASAYRLPNED